MEMNYSMFTLCILRLSVTQLRIISKRPCRVSLNMNVSGKISTGSIINMSCVGPKFHLDSAAERQPLSHCYMFHNLRSLESGERDRQIIHAV